MVIRVPQNNNTGVESKIIIRGYDQATPVHEHVCTRSIGETTGLGFPRFYRLPSGAKNPALNWSKVGTNGCRIRSYNKTELI